MLLNGTRLCNDCLKRHTERHYVVSLFSIRAECNYYQGQHSPRRSVKPTGIRTSHLSRPSRNTALIIQLFQVSKVLLGNKDCGFKLAQGIVARGLLLRGPAANHCLHSRIPGQPADYTPLLPKLLKRDR